MSAPRFTGKRNRSFGYVSAGGSRVMGIRSARAAATAVKFGATTVLGPGGEGPDVQGAYYVDYEFTYATPGVLDEGAVWFTPEPGQWYTEMLVICSEEFDGATSSPPIAKGLIMQQGGAVPDDQMFFFMLNMVTQPVGSSTVLIPVGWDNTPRIFTDDTPLVIVLRDFNDNPLVNPTRGQARIFGLVWD